MRLAGQTGAGFHAGSSRKRRRVRRRKQTGGKISVYPRTQRGGRLPAGIGIRTQRGGRLPAGIVIRTQRSTGIGAKMHWKMKKKGSNFTKQKGGIVPMAMLGPALMVAGPDKKVVKYAGKKETYVFDSRKYKKLSRFYFRFIFRKMSVVFGGSEASRAHARSSEVQDNGLDLFTVPPSNITYNGYCIVEINPTSESITPIEFGLPGSREYLDFSRSYFRIELTLKKSRWRKSDKC